MPLFLVAWRSSHRSQSSNFMSVNCGKKSVLHQSKQSCSQAIDVTNKKNHLCSPDSNVHSILSVSTVEERAFGNAPQLCQLQLWIEETDSESLLSIHSFHSFYKFLLSLFHVLQNMIISQKLSHAQEYIHGLILNLTKYKAVPPLGEVGRRVLVLKCKVVSSLQTSCLIE